MGKIEPYEINLDMNAANYAPLTPLTFIRRSARIYPDHIAQIHGDIRYTWAWRHGGGDGSKCPGYL
jgi:hypothetical protein